MAEGAKEKALAKQIRGAGVSASYDLAAVSPAAAQELVAATFGTPIEVEEMCVPPPPACGGRFRSQLAPGRPVAFPTRSLAESAHTLPRLRVTLVVGGGKKVRTAYGGPDGLTRDVCIALDKLGFTEDRGASCALDCQGSYKRQHDTDKDLMFVHVFPRVDTSAAEAAAKEASAASAASSPLPPAEQALTLSLEALQKVVPRRVGTLSQKQALLAVLKAASARCAEAEEKLARLETLPAELQAHYDSVVSLPEKQSWLTAQMDAQAQGGLLTKAEQEKVLAQLAAKLTEASAQLATASAEGKAGRVAALEAGIAKLKERQTNAAALTPVPGVAVKFEKDLKAITRTLAELEKIEACRGLQPLETVKKLRAKPELLAQVEQIREANRGWFEDPEDFEKRMAKAAKAPETARTGGGAGAGSKAYPGAGSNDFKQPKSAINQQRAQVAAIKNANGFAALGSG